MKMKFADKMVTKMALNLSRDNEVLNDVLVDMINSKGYDVLNMFYENGLITKEEMVDGYKFYEESK